MAKKDIAPFILFALFVLLSGCQTLKGACTGAGEGFKKDWEAVKRLSDTLIKADQKMQEVLW